MWALWQTLTLHLVASSGGLSRENCTPATRDIVTTAIEDMTPASGGLVPVITCTSSRSFHQARHEFRWPNLQLFQRAPPLAAPDQSALKEKEPSPRDSTKSSKWTDGRVVLMLGCDWSGQNCKLWQSWKLCYDCANCHHHICMVKLYCQLDWIVKYLD